MATDRRAGFGTRGALDATIVVIVLVASAAVAAFVAHTTRSVREGLPANLLEQQRDVAATLQALADLSGVLAEAARPAAAAPRLEPALARLAGVERQLAQLRAEHEFDVLTGVSDLHAAVAPAVEDVGRWLREGIAGFPPASVTVLSLAASRMEETYRGVYGVLDDVNAEATAILAQENEQLARFEHSLQLYLGALALVTLGVVALMVRYRFAEQRARLERERLRDSIESIDAGFALYDREDRLVLCNERYRALNPLDGDTVPGVTFARLAREGAHAAADSGHFELRLPGGRVVRVSEHPTSEGGTVGIYSEITDLRQVQDRLEQLANHDALTRLPNRHYLRGALARAMERGRAENHRFALVLLDLDRFKQVNDSFGHASGDRLLCRVAEVVRNCLRGDDIVARIGGDEFAMLLEQPRSRDEVAALARRVLAALAQPLDVGGVELRVSGSIGIALYPEHGDDPTSLERSADVAAYAAKHEGRDGFRFFSPAMRARSEARAMLASALRAALARTDSPGLRYRPVRAVGDGALAALAAVAHWQEPALAGVPEHELETLAEDAGLAYDLAGRQLAIACEHLRDWRARGLPRLPLLLPLAAAGLHTVTFVSRAARSLAEHELPPEALLIGLRESAALRDPALAGETVRRLREAGVGFALTDFGAGGASLGLLRDLAPDTLELAGALVARADEDAAARALVEASLRVARSLGIRTVASGVAGPRQLPWLREAGCDCACPDQPGLASADAAAALRELAGVTPLALVGRRP